MAFGECRRVWRVRAKQVGECWQVWRVLAKQIGECRRVWRVLAKQVGDCRRVWQVLAKPFDECWRKQDRSFYAQITYFICIKLSSLHLLNLPNLPNSLNSHKTRQTCLSRVWLVLAIWFGECRQVWRVWAKQVGECRRVWRVRHISEKDHFGKFEYLPKMANFWRVLEFAKFAREWPFLRIYPWQLDVSLLVFSLYQNFYQAFLFIQRVLSGWLIFPWNSTTGRGWVLKVWSWIVV